MGGPGCPGGHGGPASMPAPHDYNPLNARTLPAGRSHRAADALAALIASVKADAK
jgi:hypothetical protein